ncbi:MAG: YHS domain-containing (seleno)protein [Pseudomonadota bacterium]
MRNGVAGLLALMVAFIGSVAFAAKPEVYQKKSVAVSGYDTVAYFTAGEPVKGSKEFAYSWNDAEWRFSSQENLDKFKADPAAYAPQYGGYCAYAAAKGKTAPTDPEAWHIHEGKLYLNYSKGIQKKWFKDKPGYIKSADANWPGILS